MAERGIRGRRGVDFGFTRAEALVVIIVTAFLTTILMPALARVKTAAQEEVECRANLRQVGIVIHMFLQENDFRLPDCHVIRRGSASNRHFWTTDGLDSSPRLGPDDYNSYWGTAYNTYVKDVNIFGCPAIDQFAEMLANDLTAGYPGGIEAIKKASFGLNGYTDQLNTNSVRNQAEVIICTDHVEPRNEQANDTNRGDMFCIGVGDSGWQVNLSHFRPDAAGNPDHARNEHYRGIFRHNIRTDDDFQTGGRASVLWLDGRVTTIEETTGENVPNRWYDPRGKGFTLDIGWLDIQ